MSGRIPLHDHSGPNAGGVIAGSTVVLVSGSSSSSGGGSSSSAPLSVTNGVTTVTPVTSIDLQSAAVSDAGSGQVLVLPSAAARVAAYLSFR